MKTQEKVHAGFYKQCQDAIEEMGRENCVVWNVGSDFEFFSRVSAFAGDLIPNASNYWFPRPTGFLGIGINYDESSEPSVLELRSKNGSVTTIEIPEWRNVDGIVRKSS